MKIEIIKEELKEYKAGDILSIGNPYEMKNYLLYENKNDKYVGLIDLSDGTVFYEDTPCNNTFGGLIDEALRVANGENNYIADVINEWKVFSGDDITLTLGKK